MKKKPKNKIKDIKKQMDQLMNAEEQRLLRILNHGKPADKMNLINDLLNSGLISVSQALDLMGMEKYQTMDIETSVKVVKINGLEMIEWVV